MRGQQLYPTDVTAAEASAGFALEDALADYYGSRLAGVVYRSASLPGYRLVKMMATEDRMVYQLQGFGRYAHEPAVVPPRWIPLKNSNADDPNRVAEKMCQLIDERPQQRFVPHDT